MSLLINVNLYAFQKSNYLYLYCMIQIKSRIEPNHYFFITFSFFFFPWLAKLARAALISI